MSTQSQIRQQITQQIVAALEHGTLPWRRPWKSARRGRHSNVASGNAYTGVNPLLLELQALQHGFDSTLWATFGQWKKLGGCVKKRPDHVPRGKWGTQIVFYKPVAKTVVNDDGDEEEERFSLLRTYTVFNLDQVDGDALDKFRPEEVAEPQFDKYGFEKAEELITACDVDLRHGGDQAFYRRPTPEGAWPDHDDGDFIQMPVKSAFHLPTDYYEVLFHELAHWCEVRTGWDHEKHGYAMGELAAEISACYLSVEIGMPLIHEIDNHISYIKSWLKEMNDDPSFIFKASTQASKVTDFLLGLLNGESLKQAAQNIHNPLPASA